MTGFFAGVIARASTASRPDLRISSESSPLPATRAITSEGKRIVSSDDRSMTPSPDGKYCIITDGQGSTNDENHRWPNLLAARLHADPKYARFAVVDEGIGGNRILHEGGTPDARAGEHQSGLTRWSYDALDRAGVKYIILLEGINDIGHSSLIRAGLAQARQEKSPETPITASDLIHAMTQMIDEAHAKGIKVIGATLTPYGGANYERPDGQEIHSQLNDFIRHGGKFDGVIDFEKATQDPANPDRYVPAYNEKDHLHPNDEGVKAMVESIDLSLFK